jgi:hypothetical protein
VAAIVGAEGEPSRLDAARQDCRVDAGDRLVACGNALQRPAGDLSGAAVDDRVQVDLAVLGSPDLGQSMCHNASGRLTRKNPGRRRRSPDREGCSSRWARMTRCTRLRLTGRPSSRLANAATIRVQRSGKPWRPPRSPDRLVDQGRHGRGPGRHRPTTTVPIQRDTARYSAWRETHATRATTAGRYPAATTARDRARRTLIYVHSQSRDSSPATSSS